MRRHIEKTNDGTYSHKYCGRNVPLIKTDPTDASWCMRCLYAKQLLHGQEDGLPLVQRTNIGTGKGAPEISFVTEEARCS